MVEQLYPYSVDTTTVPRRALSRPTGGWTRQVQRRTQDAVQIQRGLGLLVPAKHPIVRGKETQGGMHLSGGDEKQRDVVDGGGW